MDNESYINLSYAVLKRNGLTMTQKLIYSFVRGFPKGMCVASNDYIGSIIGIKTRGVRLAVSTLEKKGYIKRKHVYEGGKQVGRILMIKKEI